MELIIVGIDATERPHRAVLDGSRMAARTGAQLLVVPRSEVSAALARERVAGARVVWFKMQGDAGSSWILVHLA